MSVSPPSPQDLLARPPLSALLAPLHAVLQEAAASAPAPAPARLAVLADTLDSLVRLGADADAHAAAFLHALPGFEGESVQRLERQFPAVHALLEGQRAAAQVWTLHAEQDAGHGNVEGLRRLLLAIVRDLRVVPILLAEQLARMRTAADVPEPARRALARLTADIHAPLANRLGIWQLKWELEDLAFRHLQPQTYHRIARLLDDKRAGREHYIAQVKHALERALAAQGVRADVAGRPKHIYSIWKKMQRKNVPIGELYDLRAVRVIVEDIPACYAALGVVHALWLPIPSEFDDYIARPKNNDYRSLHTAVVGPQGKTLEVQIRTRQMHEQSELGVAAHWRYKETGGSKRPSAASASHDRKIEWMRRLLEAHAEGNEDERALADSLSAELVEDRVYVLTPKGEVIDLPAGATPLDFAYHVHTEVGHRFRGAKVDGRIVPSGYRLASGERVEILTGKTCAPRRDWLVAGSGHLASARSRDKVRSWFHKLDRVRNVQAGREMLDKELRRLGLLQADLTAVLARFNVASVEDLQVQVALGDIGPYQVARVLLERERGAAASISTPPRRGGRRQRPADGLTVTGVGNLLTQVARCCQPLPGEEVAGYLTRARGVSVHRRDCPALLRLAEREPQRILPVEWGRTGVGQELALVAEAVDRKGLLKDISHLIVQEDAHVLDIHGRPLRGQRLHLRMRLRVRDYGQFAQLLGKLEALPGMETIRRA